MKIFLIALSGGALLLAAGCTNDSGGGAGTSLPPLPAGPPVVGAALQPKPSYARALILADQVEVGMPQSSVEAMFGRPDRAGYDVYGRATGTPWRGMVWQWVFDEGERTEVLSIVFQEVAGVWVVNHGDWPTADDSV